VAAAAKHIGTLLPPLRTAVENGDDAATPTAAPPALYGAHPVWCADRQALIWADTLAPALRLSGSDHSEQSVQIAHPIRCLLATADGIRVFHEAGSTVVDGKKRRAPPDTDRVPLAACVGADGAVWLSSLHSGKCQIGLLNDDGSFSNRWTLNHAVDCIRVDATTGLVFGTMPETGDIVLLDPAKKGVRTFARIPKSSGVLSGLDIDASGGIWTALKDGWSVMRFAADGNLDQTVPLPVPCPTGIAVGGAEGRTVFVTTARQPVPLDVLKKAPLSGRVFTLALKQ
jgi:IclR family transcriptional regulator, acetate operon repressor